MKKLLSLLSVLTVSGTAIPTTVAASSYQKENKKLLNNNIKNLKRVKRSDVPSLRDLITTINIGKIEKVNQKNILKKLSEINHPILSRKNFLENIDFENITANSAIIHVRQNILIPNSIRFTINFDSNLINFNDLLGITNENGILNFGTIINNSPTTIASEFIQRYELNDLLTVDDLIITRRPVRWTGKKQLLWDCFFLFLY
ncbi:hypothetical protein [Spiroplasma endosymbiont of Seladonia tumulorum]|uniref:hypothetical protein n=1 Tax=Spiroplasma endosymbiont of Seladonia tumulorum TaxID=3066321 RepID=UPI0030D13DD8